MGATDPADKAARKAFAIAIADGETADAAISVAVAAWRARRPGASEWDADFAVTRSVAEMLADALAQITQRPRR